MQVKQLSEYFKLLSATARNQLKYDEGLRLEVYRCTSGKLTIGYGRNLDDVGVTIEEAELLLKNDVSTAIGNTHSIMLEYSIDYKRLGVPVHSALVNFVFNVGPGTARQFKKFWSSLSRYQYYVAAAHLLDSKYARQVPNRARRVADIIRSGHNG